MNPVLADIYSTILPSAPFVIAAYALLWVALLVFVFMIMRAKGYPHRGRSSNRAAEALRLHRSFPAFALAPAFRAAGLWR